MENLLGTGHAHRKMTLRVINKEKLIPNVIRSEAVIRIKVMLRTRPRHMEGLVMILTGL